MNDWPTVDLIGKAFVIPRVCPNCMAPAESPVPTTYIKPRLGGERRYTMTFYYCDACSEVFKHAKAIERKQLSYGPKLLGVWILAFFIWLMGLSVGIANEAYEGLALLISTVIAGWIGVVLTRRLSRQRQAVWDTEKPPLPPNALGYGYAAYLIDSAGFRQKTATFSAARQQWLNLLLEANMDRG